MADDIVKRLEQVVWLAEENSEVTDLAATAAAEIMRLRGLLEDHGYYGPDCNIGKCWCDQNKKDVND